MVTGSAVIATVAVCPPVFPANNTTIDGVVKQENLQT